MRTKALLPLLFVAATLAACAPITERESYTRSVGVYCDFLTPTVVTPFSTQPRSAWKCAAAVTSYNQHLKPALTLVVAPDQHAEMHDRGTR